MDDMNLLLIFCFMLFGFTGKPAISTSKKTTHYTLPIENRVAILKQKIADQIKQKNIFDESEGTVIDEEVEYEDEDNKPLTPIDERDPRKKKELYKLKAIKTTPGIKKSDIDFDSFDVPERNIAKRGKAFERNASKKVVGRNGTKSKKFRKPKITDVFYRREMSGIGSYEWTHCQSLITPFITGQKTNISTSTRISYDHVTVIRLIQLLTEDITGHAKDDIHSILYQISNLQLRLFHWDVAAITLLLNVINSKEVKRHTFKAIKYGLKEIFRNWKLNFGSNISLLMKQTRLFRPPCVVITKIGGSTKTSKSIRYTKATTRKRCHKKDKNYEECIRNEGNDK